MNGFPSPNGPWPDIRRDLERVNRRAVFAVVGYIGKDAPQVMPLRKGDTLVCDASDAAIKGRLTSVDALRTFRRQGVELFGIEGLHAKVIASQTSGWVGSANASDNSENHLIEASIRLTSDQARTVYKWARSLATEDCRLNAAELSRLSELKLAPPRKGPKRFDPPQALPDSVKRLVFWRIAGEVSARQAAAIERDRPAAKLDARRAGRPRHLEAIPYSGDTVVKEDDWIITRRGSRFEAPGFVVRVQKTPRAGIVWLSRVPVGRRPRLADLADLVAGLSDDPVELVVRKAAVTAAILNAFKEL